MVYTVKKISELSGVTVRTLHFYEETGLLKPAYYGSNGYRYYEEKELLQLQQILFFKELGFTLKQILKVVGRSDFDQLTALHSHRKALSKEWEKIGLLLKTIDKTINHLKGKKKMKDKEIFDGFNITLVKAMEGQSYSAAEKLVVQSVKNPTKSIEDVKRRGKAYYDKITKIANALFGELVHCIEKGLDPAADVVQKIIKKHHVFVEQTHVATKDVYKAMAQLYAEHPDFRKQLDPFHIELATFMAKAMRVFADRELS
ncbi:MAG: MerR family transcriptional regulator [Parachlamydiaceae bacterium]|nr:MerR family transcriptional regulator [Parachlamydiaceae bacterium]